MSKNPAPYDNYSVWTLAGGSSDGIVYAASIEPITLDVSLWSYSVVRGDWRLLITSDDVSAPDQDWHCLMSAAFNERLGRVDIFLESQTGCGFLFRFLTGPPARLECVLSATNDANIRFEGSDGPLMHYVGDRLILAGHLLGLEGIRLFWIDTNSPPTFTLRPGRRDVENYGPGYPLSVSVGDKLLLLRGGAVSIFDSIFVESQLQLGQPSVLRGILDPVDCAVCPSTPSSNRFWFINSTNYSHEMEVADGQLVRLRSLKLASWIENFPRFAERVTAATSTHFFWIQDGEEIEIKSVLFAPPSLQSICLTSLNSAVPGFKSCDSEQRAVELRIPALAWRRFCQ